MVIFMHLYKTMYKRNYKKMHKQKWLKSNVHWVNWVPRMTLIWWQLGWASKGTWQPSYENRGHPWVRRHCEGIWAMCSRLVRRKKVCRVSFEFWAKCRTEVWEFMKHSRSEATVGKRANERLELLLQKRKEVSLKISEILMFCKCVVNILVF